jgi:peptidoglycan/xylan/chitin deacetylase (PgdA/CDA1 family)
MKRIVELGSLLRDADATRWAAWAIVLLPGLAIAGAPIEATPLLVLAVVPWAALTAYAVRRLVPDSRTALIFGLATLVLGAWLLGYASYPGSGYVVANVVGAGTGLLAPPTKRPGRSAAATIAIVALGLVLFRWAISAEAAGLAACAVALVVTVASLADARLPIRPRRAAAVIGSVMVLYLAFAVFWVGSTAPSVQWFGALTSHGSRNSNMVAITFDDGPNPPYTEQIAGILESYGVRGTFFEVGKAVVQAPGTTQRLFQAGHLVGNHSYTHGNFTYLDPAYPELAQTQRAIQQAGGSCPAVFRPPHGTHTPFMSRVVTDAGMRLVTWDVSAKDWIETDPDALARNILAKVKPGSIILLHDGLNGNIGADRSVVVQALPKILDGLKAKGYEVVRLDVLLGFAPTLKNC